MVPRSFPAQLALLTGALVALAAAPRASVGEEEAVVIQPVIYKWVDENGIGHYTTDPDRIPKSLRNRIRSLQGEVVTTDSERWAVRDTPPVAVDPGPVAVDGGPPLPASLVAPFAPEEIAALDGEIAGIESAIADDEAALVEMLSRPQSTAPLSDDPAFREIAERLPRLEEELRALRDRRAALQGTRNPTP